jgi:cytochrome b561
MLLKVVATNWIIQISKIKNSLVVNKWKIGLIPKQIIRRGNMSTERPQRYPPIWVTLHWAIALLLFIEIILGFGTRYVPSTLYPAVIRTHMPLGITILVLMITRIVIRSRTTAPEPATAGNPILDGIGVITHILLYALAVLMPLAGIDLAISYNLIQVNLGVLTEFLIAFGPLHRWIALSLVGLIALHIGAVFYHQLIRKDNLLSRMWYETNTGPSSES